MDEDVGTGVGPSERAHHAGGGGSTPERRRRMSARRKQDAVLRLLRGEDLELLSRELGVTAAELSGWRERLPGRWRGVVEEPACRRSGCRDRPPQGEGRRPDDGQRAARGEDRAAGDRPPFGTPEVEAMSRQVSPSTDQVYGLQRVTRIWGVSRATVYRHRHQPEAIERRRPGPLGAMADEELVRAIRQLLQDSPFHGEGYRKLWARLRFAGIRTSRRRVLRLMREHGLLAHQRAGRPRGSRAHDGTITTERVDLMWGTDLTSVMTGEGQAAVFIAVDHCSAECVGLHASRSADRFEALEPVRQGVRERFGAFGKNVASRPRPSPRSRHPVREPPLPGRDPLPRHRELAGLRPRARRQRLRRALHPGAEGKPASVIGRPRSSPFHSCHITGPVLLSVVGTAAAT